MKVAVISQPRYLPAISYLQRLHFADLFVFLDDVQRQSRGWENRNKILTDGKEKWLTIPISSPSRAKINDSKIQGKEWVKSHKDLIHDAYSKHPYYNSKIVASYYLNIDEVLENLNYNFADIVIHLVLNACKIFDFTPKVIRSSACTLAKNWKGPRKLLEICEETGSPVYISGANGREYRIKETFKSSPVKVLFHDYKYPRYKQHKHKNFTQWLSFFDPVFNLGLERVKKWIYAKPVLSKN